MRVAVLIIVLWIICGVIADGLWVGNFYFEEHSSYGPRESVRSLLWSGGFWAMIGPMGLAAGLMSTGGGEHGICFTEKGCEYLMKGK